MDILNLTENQMLLAIAAAGCVVGMLLTRLIFRPAKNTSGTEDPRNHQIRQLEADLRTLKRQYEEAVQALDAKNEECDLSMQTLTDLRSVVNERDAEVDELQSNLKGEVKKTRELRQELQDRATETIREHVRAKEAETELEVARAGSEAVMSEINRLQEERKNLTDTMRHLEESLLPDEELFSESAD